MAIRVMLEDHTGNVRQQANLSENAAVSRLIRAIITTLKMPVTDSAGRPITYYLAHNGRRLQENDTLLSAEVQADDTINIVPQFTAGTQSEQGTYPLVVLDGVPNYRPPLKGFPSHHLIDASTGITQVWFNPDAMTRVWRHAKSNLLEEIGGILVGRVYEEKGRFLVKVEDAFQAQHTLASAASLTFTDQTWLDLLQQKRVQADDLFVLGWYHSHPGFGIFLSTSDLFIHRHFFSDQPWYLALVVDPFSNDWGVFGWEDGETRRCSRG